MRFLFLWTISFLAAIAQSSSATERSFEFTGTVFQVFSPPFGENISAFSTVTGGFVYESNSIATHSTAGCDCTGYQQQHINGFWADFDGVLVRADDYVVEVANDVVQPTTEVNDVVTIKFSSALTPAPEVPLLVAGIPRSAGLFSISLFASSDLYSDSTLPASLDPSDFFFPPLSSLLGDTPNGLIDSLFSINTFQTTETLASDHDLDGDVDGNDFLIWQRSFGSSGQNGDADSNGEVNNLDLSIWQSQYGMDVVSLQQAVGVPEPTTNSLVIIAIYFVSHTHLLRKHEKSS